MTARAPRDPRGGAERRRRAPDRRSRRLLTQGHQLRHDHAPMPDGTVDTSGVEGVDPDLRVRPFFAHGGTISIREFVVGAFKAEMGLAGRRSRSGRRAVRRRGRPPAGMVLDGVTDTIESRRRSRRATIGTRRNSERRSSIIWSSTCSTTSSRDSASRPPARRHGRRGVAGRSAAPPATSRTCASSGTGAWPTWRRSSTPTAASSTACSPPRGRCSRTRRSIGQAGVAKIPALQPFVVENIFTDFKRHDLGPNFHERNYDGTMPHAVPDHAAVGRGHHGALRPRRPQHQPDGSHPAPRRRGAGGARRVCGALVAESRCAIAFLNSLILFPPDDTASNLDPGDPAAAGFPQFGHGSIRLTDLFNNPAVVE